MQGNREGVLQRILGRCLPPTETGKAETGLVVGYVQSGKTMSFETVIALARDNGYGLIIVLAGTKNNLRDQSEDRLKKDLGIDDGGDHWYHLSNPTSAVQSQIESKLATCAPAQHRSHHHILIRSIRSKS